MICMIELKAQHHVRRTKKIHYCYCFSPFLIKECLGIMKSTNTKNCDSSINTFVCICILIVLYVSICDEIQFELFLYILLLIIRRAKKIYKNTEENGQRLSKKECNKIINSQYFQCAYLHPDLFLEIFP